MNIDFLIESVKLHTKTVAVITDGIEYTFEDIYKYYLMCKDILNNRGVQKGSITAVLADFKPMSIAMVMALIEHDCIIVPISATIKNIDRYVCISESEYYIDLIDDELLVKPTGIKVVHTFLRDLKKKGNPGLILFSSGTTGEPKAGLHDLECLLEKFKKPGKILRTITFLLFDHIGGFNTMMHTLANGGTIVTIRSRQFDHVCQTIEKYKVELLPTSPTFLNMLLLNRVHEKYDLSSLKVISYGTEPMPESTLIALHGIFPNISLKQTYGLSELGIMGTKSESSDSLWLKLGGDGFEIKILDDILYIRAKSAMIGYLNAKSPFDEEGWFKTQDKVESKGEYIKILGRTTDIINVGGMKVYPIEVESALLQCEGVKDASVSAEKNPLTGSMVVAKISVLPENNNREFIKKLRYFCKDNLEPFKIPARFTLFEGDLYGDRLKKKR